MGSTENIVFRYYEESMYDELLGLARASYAWEVPSVGVSRIEFAHAVNKVFCDSATSWEKTVGCWLEHGKLAACVWNEGCYDGTVFFLFDSRERAREEELLAEMIRFARTYGAGCKSDGRTRFVNVFVPEWNTAFSRIAREHGLEKGGWTEHYNIFSFRERQYEVRLPEGYQIIDGHKTPELYLAMVHRHAFGYGVDDRATEHGQEGFRAMRRARYYDPELELCVLDPQGRPVAMANVWIPMTQRESSGSIPCPESRRPEAGRSGGAYYAELEPLAVCWWERRRGIATALLHEEMNRILRKYPACGGMLGGDQAFYKSLGFETRAAATAYYWETEIFMSWDVRSRNMEYGNIFGLRKEVDQS